MGAQNFNFTLNISLNGRSSPPNYVFWEENFPTKGNASDRHLPPQPPVTTPLALNGADV